MAATGLAGGSRGEIWNVQQRVGRDEKIHFNAAACLTDVRIPAIPFTTLTYRTS